MDASVVKKTQDTLGKVIKKPPLTEKLLNKPPFRFLHDVITEVIKNTGVLKGLFSQEEMNSTNVTDRDAKINFLQKAIDCIGILTGQTLPARPSKIVAGHEPEKTNEFLQALGIACIKKMDSSDAVKKVLGGDKPSSGKPRKKEGSSAKDRSSSKERASSKDRKDDKEKEVERTKSSSKREDKDKREDRDKRKDRAKVEDKKEREDKKKESSSRERSSKKAEKDGTKEREKDRGKEREKEQEKEMDKEKREAEKVKERDREIHKEKEIKDNTKIAAAEDTAADESNIGDDNDDDLSGSRNIQRPSSAKGQRRRPSHSDGEKQEQDEGETEEASQPADEPGKQLGSKSKDSKNATGVEQTSNPPTEVRRVARPSSARPAPPRIKKQEDVEEPLPRLPSNVQPLAPVIVDDAKETEDDEDATFVVEETEPTTSYFDQNQSDSVTDVNSEDHGSLVKKMLDSKKEADVVQKHQYETEKPVIETAAKRKERELAEKEIERLRGSIQTLCRSAHPLGKIMDYLQEDIDSMQKELEVWRKENEQHKVELKAEQSITDSEIEPLQAQLGELELEVTDMMERISGIKCSILKNDGKIRELVLGISG